jgi:hypothetical protein
VIVIEPPAFTADAWVPPAAGPATIAAASSDVPTAAIAIEVQIRPFISLLSTATGRCRMRARFTHRRLDGPIADLLAAG